MGIGKLPAKLGSVINSVVANGQKTAKKLSTGALPTKQTTLSANKALSAMDAASQSARAAITKSSVTPKKANKVLDGLIAADKPAKKIIPNFKEYSPKENNILKQLAKSTVSSDFSEKAIISPKITAQEAVNGAKEVMHATGMQNTPKNAEESAKVFIEAGKTKAEAKMEQLELKNKLQKEFGKKLTNKKIQEAKTEAELNGLEKFFKANINLDKILDK